MNTFNRAILACAILFSFNLSTSKAESIKPPAKVDPSKSVDPNKPDGGKIDPAKSAFEIQRSTYQNANTPASKLIPAVPVVPTIRPGVTSTDPSKTQTHGTGTGFVGPILPSAVTGASKIPTTGIDSNSPTRRYVGIRPDLSGPKAWPKVDDDYKKTQEASNKAREKVSFGSDKSKGLEAEIKKLMDSEPAKSMDPVQRQALEIEIRDFLASQKDVMGDKFNSEAAIDAIRTMIKNVNQASDVIATIEPAELRNKFMTNMLAYYGRLDNGFAIDRLKTKSESILKMDKGALTGAATLFNVYGTTFAHFRGLGENAAKAHESAKSSALDLIKNKLIPEGILAAARKGDAAAQKKVEEEMKKHLNALCSADCVGGGICKVS